MSRYIIREVEPEACDFSFYFDGDTFSESGGDYCYTLFIVPTSRNRGYHEKEYKAVQSRAKDIIDDFAALRGDGWYAPTFDSYKKCMEYYGIPYTPRKCHALKEWAEQADESEPESIAAFLTITTGKKWETCGVSGYSQGDFVELVYCPEHYRDGVEAEGEIWMGCAKEFDVIELDDDGEEIDRCGGYIIADCQAWRDEDYKRLVCEWAGIDEQDAELEIIDGCYTTTHYNYRTA